MGRPVFASAVVASVVATGSTAYVEPGSSAVVLQLARLLAERSLTRRSSRSNRPMSLAGAMSTKPTGADIMLKHERSASASAPRLSSKHQVAERLGVSIRTIERWLHAGELAAYKLGRQWRISEDDLRAFLAERRGIHTNT